MRILLFTIFLAAGQLFGQSFPDHILDAITLRQSGSTLELNWVMGRGVECLGIDVQRSVNGSPFERVYSIGGVCGSPERPEPYGFSDSDLTESGEYTYLISFGSIGEAQISIVFAAVWESGISVSPRDGAHVLRTEGVQGSYDVRVYHINGRSVFSADGILEPTLALPSETWESGIYVVQILNPLRSVTQKFAVYGR